MQMRSLLIAGVILAIAGAGCGASNAVKGGAIGALGGAAIGALIGNQAGNTALGAIIGAAVGGTAGALIGANMDRQVEEMRKDLKNAKIVRVGEGIKITFESGILFKTGSATLNATSQENIKKLASILNKYPDTNILVEGHTDSTGTEELNQTLSERRAQSVSNLCVSTGVKSARFNVMGYGEGQPIADNESDEGRQQNRRVEVAIFANEKMKKAAENGTLK
jgi:outer membrane protein OmpA-like peptidoglycan-associated protein